MKQLSEQQIIDNWNKLIKLIEDTFQGERKDKILEMKSTLDSDKIPEINEVCEHCMYLEGSKLA